MVKRHGTGGDAAHRLAGVRSGRRRWNLAEYTIRFGSPEISGIRRYLSVETEYLLNQSRLRSDDRQIVAVY